MEPKRVITDPTENKQHDALFTEDDKAVRKELVDNLAVLMQGSLNDKLSGGLYKNNLEAVDNSLYEKKAYAESMKSAAIEILLNYGNDSPIDGTLREIADMSDVIIEGVDRVTQYLEMVTPFGDDLNKIVEELYVKIQELAFEE